MKILHTECGLNWGGQEFRTLIECSWLNQHGHRAWIMCHPDSELFKRGQLIDPNMVIAVDFTNVWRLDNWFKIVQFVAANKIDIINTHGSRDSSACLLAKLLGTPLLRSRQVTNPIKHSLSYRYGCTHIIAAAEAIRRDLMSHGVPKKQISVIGEGVDTEEFAPRPKPRNLISELAINDEKVVINIGMLRTDKGQRYFVEAAHELIRRGSTARFFIIGDATRKKAVKKELQSLISSLGISSQCQMLGYRDNIAEFINLADLVVIASTGTEAQSRIAPQSFASKTPVVSTDTGGLTELVKHQINGLVVPAGSTSELANAIEKLLNDEKLHSRLAQEGYQFALQELSLGQMMEKTVNLYDRFANNADQENGRHR